MDLLDEFLLPQGQFGADPMMDWGDVVVFPATPLSQDSTEAGLPTPLVSDPFELELSRSSFDSAFIDLPEAHVLPHEPVHDIPPAEATLVPEPADDSLLCFEQVPKPVLLAPSLVLLEVTRNPSRFLGGEETNEPLAVKPENNNWPIYSTKVHRELYSSSGILPLNTSLIPTRVVLVHIRGVRMRFEAGVGRGRNPVNEQTGLSVLYSHFFVVFERSSDCTSNNALILLPDIHGNYGPSSVSIRLPVGRILVTGVQSARTSSNIRYESHVPFRTVIGPLVTNAREIDKYDYYRDLLDGIEGSYKADMIILQGPYRRVVKRAITVASEQFSARRALELPAALCITKESITPDQMQSARKLRAKLRTSDPDLPDPPRKHGALGKRKLPLAPKTQ